MHLTIPLFPLNTVLFPGGMLPLRIFEPRYLDMISNCLKIGCGIGVVLIEHGREVGSAAETHPVGTLSEIHYWHQRSDGMLGLTLRGKQRFRILSQQVLPNQLIQAEVELLPEVIGQQLEPQYAFLAKMLENILSQLEPPYSTMPTRLDDADWVASRLIELLPIDLLKKQEMLLIDSPNIRLKQIASLLQNLRE